MNHNELFIFIHFPLFGPTPNLTLFVLKSMFTFNHQVLKNECSKFKKIYDVMKDYVYDKARDILEKALSIECPRTH